MKVIHSSSAAQTVTFLPDEILDLIVSYVRLGSSPNAVQRYLWTCCLISRDWYAAAIKHLYAQPILYSRNFDLFARTLSPPLSSRSRRIGLENFVTCLDMGGLAYESKKSTTSRLISRTKASLMEFVAPAVSFSTTALAPLSKCSRLQYLDLSRDAYDFDMTQLMRSIKHLDELNKLSLPKNILLWHSTQTFEKNIRVIASEKTDFWPSNLTHLQFNEFHMEPSGEDWKALLLSLPLTLEFLSFRNVMAYDTFDAIGEAQVTVPQVTTLSVGVGVCDDTYSFDQLTQSFPNLRKVILPGMTVWILRNFMFMSNDQTWSLTASSPVERHQAPQKLEVLILEQSPDFPATNVITIPELMLFVDTCPKLLHIEVPEAYLGLRTSDGKQDEDDLDELNSRLRSRAEGIRNSTGTDVDIEDVGVFLTDNLNPSGVGMKRSLRYRENR